MCIRDSPDTEISLEEARRALPHVQLGDVVSSEIKPKNFGRIAAQTARQAVSYTHLDVYKRQVQVHGTGAGLALLDVVQGLARACVGHASTGVGGQGGGDVQELSLIHI